MGTDQWNTLNLWAKYEHFISLVDIIVCTRGGEPLNELEVRPEVIQTSHPASSTQIRDAIKEDSPPQWVDPEVFSYLNRAELYK